MAEIQKRENASRKNARISRGERTYTRVLNGTDIVQVVIFLFHSPLLLPSDDIKRHIDKSSYTRGALAFNARARCM